MVTELLLYGVSLAVLLAASLHGMRGLQRAIEDTGQQIHRCAVHQRELLQVIENHRLLQEVQNVTESLVDEGTSVVRTIHKEIASIPFEILEAIPATRDTTRVVRGVHDVTSDSIYAGISVANRLLGRGLRKSMRVSDATENEIAPDAMTNPDPEKKSDS